MTAASSSRVNSVVDRSRVAALYARSTAGRRSPTAVPCNAETVIRSAKSRNGKRRSRSSRTFLALFGRQSVPFVGDYDQRPAPLDNQAKQADVLLGNAFLRIEHRNNHMRFFYRLQRFDDTEFLDGLTDSRLATNSRGIDQRVLAVVALERHLDRVTGCARLVENDEPLFAEQAIRECRLANIGPPDNRDAQIMFVVGFRELIFASNSASTASISALMRSPCAAEMATGSPRPSP